VDALGNPVTNRYLIVLHETVSSGLSAINTFRTYHPRDDDQRSYHDLILLDGTIVHLLAWEKRAFGAGNSEFRGEAVQTNPKLPSSVNNFALHFSLETPPDGYHNGPRHRGYTEAQYRSLAWLAAQSQIEDDRITTHKAVDRSQGKQDPRSFDGPQFQAWLQEFRQSAC
jgi:N-acetyl-anhydromuramyl-L-alanine amidase AmpD